MTYMLQLLILATRADVSLLMQLEVDGVFVGSRIVKNSNPPERPQAIALPTLSPKTIGRSSRRVSTNKECNPWCKITPSQDIWNLWITMTIELVMKHAPIAKMYTNIEMSNVSKCKIKSISYHQRYIHTCMVFN